MAYDKVVDSSVLDANLTAIADAIREKAGVEDTFAFPAGFVEAIAGIESGGGGNAVWGLFTPASTSLLTIEHGLGKRPVACGVLNTVVGENATQNTMGAHISLRIGVGTGNYTTETIEYAIYAKNTATYPKHSEATRKYIDSEDSGSISESKYYNGNLYYNKNFLKVLPSASHGQYNTTVGETYIWFVLGVD